MLIRRNCYEPCERELIYPSPPSLPLRSRVPDSRGRLGFVHNLRTCGRSQTLMTAMLTHWGHFETSKLGTDGRGRALR